MKKMKINRKKKPMKIIIIVSLIVILLLIIILYNLNTKPTTNYFYSKDLGMITVQTKVQMGIAKFFNFFQQAVTFAQTTATVGDTISLTDTHTVAQLVGVCQVGVITITINGPTQDVNIPIVLDTPASNFDEISEDATLTVLNEGVYSATTTYHPAECIGNVCQATSTCGDEDSWTDSADNSVTVSPANNGECELETTCGDWINDADETIENGQVSKKMCRDPVGDDADCVLGDEYLNEQKTECDVGYYIVDSDPPVAGAAGVNDCELPDAPNEDCTVDGCTLTTEICNEDTKQCQTANCNADQTKTCADNSTIITLECINDISTSTGNKCPEDTNNTGNKTPTIYQINCWIQNSTIIPEESVFSTEEPCVNDTYKSATITCDDEKGYYSSEKACVDSTKEINFITWSIIIGSVIVILIVLVFVIRKIRK